MPTGRPPESRYDHRIWSVDFTPTGNQDRATSVGEPCRELINSDGGQRATSQSLVNFRVGIEMDSVTCPL
jgi:hypothetical protein